MSLTRVVTYREGKTALIVECDGREHTILRDDLPMSDATLQSSLRTLTGLRIFAHYNRDGTVALATGHEPVRWPEDE